MIHMSMLLPLISCICVTRNKPELLKRAIACFLAQTYARKELVILYEDDDHATGRFAGQGFPAESGILIFKVTARPRSTLGELRNHAIQVARGEFVCQWDDDDWYHMNRLTEQYGRLAENNRDGSVLTQWLLFDSLTEKAYVSNVRLWEGSILCRKDVLQLRPYENKEIGEDTATIEYLAGQDRLHPMDERSGLYIYVYHGRNTWNYEHWTHIFQCSTALAGSDSKIVSDILKERYSVVEGSQLLDAF